MEEGSATKCVTSLGCLSAMGLRGRRSEVCRLYAAVRCHARLGRAIQRCSTAYAASVMAVVTTDEPLLRVTCSRFVRAPSPCLPPHPSLHVLSRVSPARLPVDLYLAPLMAPQASSSKSTSSKSAQPSNGSLSSIVSQLVRSQLGVTASQGVKDDDLDKHVANMLLQEARDKEKAWGSSAGGGRSYLDAGGEDK